MDFVSSIGILVKILGREENISPLVQMLFIKGHLIY